MFANTNTDVSKPINLIREFRVEAPQIKNYEKTFTFVTPVTYRNSFLDLEDYDSQSEKELANQIDNYYENTNEMLEDDE